MGGSSGLLRKLRSLLAGQRAHQCHQPVGKGTAPADVADLSQMGRLRPVATTSTADVTPSKVRLQGFFGDVAEADQTGSLLQEAFGGMGAGGQDRHGRREEVAAVRASVLVGTDEEFD